MVGVIMTNEEANAQFAETLSGLDAEVWDRFASPEQEPDDNVEALKDLAMHGWGSYGVTDADDVYRALEVEIDRQVSECTGIAEHDREATHAELRHMYPGQGYTEDQLVEIRVGLAMELRASVLARQAREFFDELAED